MFYSLPSLAFGKRMQSVGARAMTVKTKAVEMLGETMLALPALVADALIANDHIKYLFSVLQAARSHADRSWIGPRQPGG
jgi:hypothetical protein